MGVTSRVQATAERFAKALDADDFTCAEEFLAPDCEYHIDGRLLVGTGQIINSYRNNSEWGQSVLDAVEFGSRVESVADNEVVISFTDRIKKGDLSHVFQCRQLLTIDERRELITRIQHQDVGGEREALQAFFDRCGITRRER